MRCSTGRAKSCGRSFLLRWRSVLVGLSANTFCAYYSLTVSGKEPFLTHQPLLLFWCFSSLILPSSYLKLLSLLQHKQKVSLHSLLIIGYMTTVKLESTLAADMICKTQYHAGIAAVSLTHATFLYAHYRLQTARPRSLDRKRWPYQRCRLQDLELR